ncbi:MAG: sulfatase [Verrucomicrobiota bacterium]
MLDIPTQSALTSRQFRHHDRPAGWLLGLHILSATLGLCLYSNAGDVPPPAAVRKPNVILILVDDLGYGDLGCYGSTKNRTPAVDKLASEGLMLTSFYVSSGVCSPSRSSLMSGCYPLRIGMHVSSKGCYVLVPGDERGLNPAEMTLPRMLKQQDYATICIGKWHLGDQAPFMPRCYGFDSYFGIPFSNDMGSEVKGELKGGLPELPLLRNETVIEAPVDQNGITARYTAEAIAFIEKNKDRPFFLYLPHMQVHLPLRSGERYRGKSAAGAYTDSVEEMDGSTGEIMATLKKLGLDNNTLVIFTSDNGSYHPGSNLPLSGGKATTMEGGMREPCIMRWPGHIPAGSTCDEVAATIDLLPTLAHLTGATLPTDRAIDGKDISDLMQCKPGARSPHTEGYFYYFMSQLQAVRLNQWKLRLSLDPEISGFTGQPKGKSELRLYDLMADPGEKINLAADHSAIVAQLTALAATARQEIGDYQVKGRGQREPGHFANPQIIRMTPADPSEK